MRTGYPQYLLFNNCSVLALWRDVAWARLTRGLRTVAVPMQAAWNVVETSVAMSVSLRRATKATLVLCPEHGARITGQAMTPPCYPISNPGKSLYQRLSSITSEQNRSEPTTSIAKSTFESMLSVVATTGLSLNGLAHGSVCCGSMRSALQRPGHAHCWASGYSSKAD